MQKVVEALQDIREMRTKVVDASNVVKMVIWQENVPKLVTVVVIEVNEVIEVIEVSEEVVIAASNVEKKVISLEIAQKLEKEATTEAVSNAVKKDIWLENVQTHRIKKVEDVEEEVEEALVLASNAIKKVTWQETVQTLEVEMTSKTQEHHTNDQEEMTEMASKKKMMMLGVAVVGTSNLMAGATATLKAIQSGEAISF